MKRIKYKVERSKYPEEKNTHLVVSYSVTSHGYNIQRVFKGTYKECVDKKKELEVIKSE